MKKKLTPKSCGHKTVPLDHFQSFRIILRSVDTIQYPHTNQDPTLQQFPLSCRSVPNGFKFALDSAGSGHPEQFFASNGKRHCNVPWITAIQLSFGPHEADIMGLDTLS